jgi:hypothetical protein
VTYRDNGCHSFGVDYDSTVAEGPGEGAFRPAGDVTITGTREWKTAELRLPDCRFMNRGNGADFRLAVRGGELELAIRHVELRKAD